eukprot:COSAG06_NODE_6831_length_2753_cov_6.636045_2_plen_87_part_00
MCVRMCSQQMYYTCLKIAVISYKPLRKVLSIYTYSDRFDLIYLGWGKTPPRSILGGICFWIGGGVEPLHTYLLPPHRRDTFKTGQQ